MDGVMSSSLKSAALAKTGANGKVTKKFVLPGEPGANRKDKDTVQFVYPYGSTLQVQRPAVPVLCSGHIAYPLSRPTGAVCQGQEKGAGRIAVIGSADMFADDWCLDTHSKQGDPRGRYRVLRMAIQLYKSAD